MNGAGQEREGQPGEDQGKRNQERERRPEVKSNGGRPGPTKTGTVTTEQGGKPSNRNGKVTVRGENPKGHDRTKEGNEVNGPGRDPGEDLRNTKRESVDQRGSQTEGREDQRRQERRQKPPEGSQGGNQEVRSQKRRQKPPERSQGGNQEVGKDQVTGANTKEVGVIRVEVIRKPLFWELTTFPAGEDGIRVGVSPRPRCDWRSQNSVDGRVEVDGVEGDDEDDM